MTSLHSGVVYRVMKCGLRLVARESPQGGFDLFTPNVLLWSGTRGQAPYRALPDGRIVYHGNPTGWFTDDLQPTGQTIRNLG
jgi:hypothetical protein